MAEKRLKAAAAMHHAKNKRLFVFDAVHNHIFAYSHGAIALDVAAFICDVKPNIVKVAFRV